MCIISNLHYCLPGYCCLISPGTNPSIHITQTQRHHAMFFTATRTSIRQKTFGHIVFQTDATWMKPIFTRFTLHPKPTRVLLHLAMAPRVDLLRTAPHTHTKNKEKKNPETKNKHDNMRSKHSTPLHHHHHHNTPPPPLILPRRPNDGWGK